MHELKLGLIGCGKHGRIHVESVNRIEGARFTAYADVNSQAANELLEQFGGDYATTDANTLIHDDTLDAVYICTRHDSHAPLATAAAEAGRHIFLEKPLALTLAECKQIWEAVHRSNVWLMPGFKMRYSPLIQQAHAFIPQPQVIVAQIMDQRWPDDAWPQDPIQGGANVFSQGCHGTDLIRYLAGSEPRRLWATGGAMSHPGHPCIDQCACSIELDNGHIASWVQGDAAMGAFTGKFFIQLFGDGKSVQIHNRHKSTTFCDSHDTWTVEREDVEGYLQENKAFITSLQKGQPPELTVDDGLQAMRIVLAADQAIRTGEIQVLAPHQ